MMCHNDVQALVEWASDAKSLIESKIDSLADELRDRDAQEQERAAELIAKLLDYLPPRPALTEEEKDFVAMRIMADETATTRERRERLAALHQDNSKPKRGRPRELVRDEFAAYQLYYSTDMEYAEIALLLRGCKHAGRTIDRSCDSCADAIKSAIKRLKKVMRDAGIVTPNLRQFSANELNELLRR